MQITGTLRTLALALTISLTTAATAPALAAESANVEGTATKGAAAEDIATRDTDEAATTADVDGASTSRYIVTLEDGSTLNEAETAAQEVAQDLSADVADATPIATDELGTIQLDEALTDAEADTFIEQLEQQPGIASVEPDVLMHAYETADLTGDMWAIKPKTSTNYGIDAVGAWSTSTGKGVVVAVVDTGTTGHADLAGQTLSGYDFVSGVRVWTAPEYARDRDKTPGWDSDPSDPGDWCTASGYEANSSWHGTHVTGTIAAANNGQGTVGVAYNSKILPVRALGSCSSGYLSDIAAAVVWASGGSVSGVTTNKNPADVINLSLGISRRACPTVMQSAIDIANQNGSVVVAASGNSGGTGGTAESSVPANCDDVIAVGASKASGVMPTWSDTSGGLSNYIAAPGDNILSTSNTGTTTPGSATYLAESGTSMATPHVSATIALLRQLDAGTTAAVALNALKHTATDWPTSAGYAASRYGPGIINAEAAVSTWKKRASTASVKVTVPRFTKGTKPKATVRVAKASNGAWPTGTVTISINGTTRATRTLKASDHGKITVTLPKQTKTIKVKARYSGSLSVASKASPTVRVKPKATVKTVKVTGKKFKRGGKPKVKVSVSKTSDKKWPTGKVRIYVGKKAVKTVTLKAKRKGKITVKLPKQKAKSIKVKAKYLGNSSTTAKTSKTVKIKRR